MLSRLSEDIAAVRARDPAARSRVEVALCYPGFHALLFYRVSHGLWVRGWRLLGRWVSQVGRFVTGIEIHPGSVIGRRFFIDHGMGVVVGETAEVGDDVTLYQGVTLGGVSPAVDSHAQVNVKRHPTLEDGVIVGSGAQVLGPIRVGSGARIGSNAVVVRDVAAGATVVGIPARAAGSSHAAAADDRGFAAYGLPGGDIPDPVARVCDNLIQQVDTLAARVAELERQLAERESEPVGRGARTGTGS